MNIDGLELAQDIDIKRRKVKYARIRVDKNLGVTVIIPLNFKQEEVNALLKSKTGWISKQLDYFKNKKDETVKLNIDEIMFLGHIYKFKPQPELKKSHLIDNTNKIISSGLNMLKKEILIKWYKEEAKRILTERLHYFTSKYNFSYNRFFIRSQKTVWGSCSRKRNLSFNWKLIQTPPTILDYIVAHELVHTRVFNHSKTYWDQVALIYPDYKTANKWLKGYDCSEF